MLSVHGRKPAAVVVEPVAKGLLKAGVTPNMITLAGTIATMLAMMVLIPTDHLVWAAVLSTIFAACDMVDGTMARLRGGGTAFGATLDASCDRLTDGALFGSIAMWMVYVADLSAVHVAACLAVLVLSQAISYIKARAEAGGISVVGGLIERPERLILALGGLALEGFGVPNAVVVSIWILLAGSLFTVVQRLVFAARDDQANAKMAPPAGA
ncbi:MULTISPECIES: phosphatidylinositol phosphate synthase [Corynebacterium]|uniref:phosphatidylinositol phosphate synthase n=1 Tax=Corynebacterium TaxID=1716 RepID=UPI0008A84AF7|nr:MULTISPECIES: CDP-alcohol phosphatidyltransferase family protein [Corynebacterium]OHO31915.1 phosphatidylglycerophosphate synthase [Corynebacterium sp. HMSC034B08]OHQ51237.1 phosphatidylglycerophosphate synthase [Corynebacterium sp. HMSC070H05]UBI07970.1 CDP-alcohol phosphatidyltransferase family protein [Corynebacterium coyleae]